MNLFFFRVNTQFENLGDLLINKQLVIQMSNNGPLYICSAKAPKEFIEQILDFSGSRDLIFMNRASFYLKMIVAAFSRNSEAILFLNPGGYSGAINRKTFYKKCLSASFLKILSILGVKICQVGVSFDRFNSLHLRYLRFLRSSLLKLMVRDSGSLKYLDENGISADGLLPDLALCAKYEPANQNANYEFILSFREPCDPESRDTLFSMVVEFCQSSNKKIQFVYQVESDKVFLEKILVAVDKSSIDLVKVNSLREASRVYSSAEYVISNRLHVILIAASVGVRPLALVDGKENLKIIGVMQEINLMSNLLDYRSGAGSISDYYFDGLNNLSESFSDVNAKYSKFFSGL